MKTRIRTTLLLSTIACSLVLMAGGCSKKGVIPPESAGMGGQDSSAYPSTSGGYSEDSLPLEGTLDDTTSRGSSTAMEHQSDEYKMANGRCSEGLKPVFFDFDSASIRSDMVQTMLDNAEYLKQIPSSYVIVEGNTDDRGTNEYNLALGERRAQNTRQYLIDLGVGAANIRTISYGEEKPLFPGSDERAYTYNRRADFVLE